MKQDQMDQSNNTIVLDQDIEMQLSNANSNTKTNVNTNASNDMDTSDIATTSSSSDSDTNHSEYVPDQKQSSQTSKYVPKMVVENMIINTDDEY